MIKYFLKKVSTFNIYKFHSYKITKIHCEEEKKREKVERCEYMT